MCVFEGGEAGIDDRTDQYIIVLSPKVDSKTIDAGVIVDTERADVVGDGLPIKTGNTCSVGSSKRS